MTQKPLTVLFFTVLILLVITGSVYLFLTLDTAVEKQTQDKAEDLKTAENTAKISENSEADSAKINVDQINVQVSSIEDFQNTLSLMEQNNIVRNKFLFMHCPDCESGFAIQDCMDLLQDAKQDPEVLHMANSIGLDMNNVHRINKKHEASGIFCYFYT